jgi:GNAT superfamily N-acetyltransferase
VIVIIRTFKPDLDSGFIYGTWAKGAYFGAQLKTTTPKRKWFEDYHYYIADQLEKSRVLVACLSNHPDTIIGYAVINFETLEWIYVKEMFRKQGIAKLLIQNNPIKYVNNLTRVGRAIAEKHDLKEKEDGTELQHSKT